MRLAIADPPYPPNLLSTGHGLQRRASRWYGEHGRHHTAADVHPDAFQWDDPARHRSLLAQLVAGYDGWALATSLDAVAMVYPPLPPGTKIMIWHRKRATPGRHRIITHCEAVLVWPPEGRRNTAGGSRVHDWLSTPGPGVGSSFAGAKPAAWTRWVLDTLGYDHDTDTVHDLFPGSGAVSAEIAQGILW